MIRVPSDCALRTYTVRDFCPACGTPTEGLRKCRFDEWFAARLANVSARFPPYPWAFADDAEIAEALGGKTDE